MIRAASGGTSGFSFMPKTPTSETDDNTLAMPEIHVTTAENIGGFVIAWGTLERELDVAFPVLFHIDATLSICLYANLGTKSKIDILGSAVTMLAAQLGAHTTSRAHSILSHISDLGDKARNTIAHGQLTLFRDENSAKQQWELVRHAARKAASIVIHPGNARYWSKQETIALRLAQQWRACVGRMHPKLGHLNPDDLEKICLDQLKESAPSYARPRENRSPKKGGLGGRQTSLAKWPRI
jgi:hypothetical protein